MQMKIKQSHMEQNTRCIRGKTLHGKKRRALLYTPIDNQALYQLKVTSKNSHPFPSWWLNLRTMLTCRPLAVHFRHAWTDHLECLFKMIQPRIRRRTPMLRTSDQQSISFGEGSNLSLNDARAWEQESSQKDISRRVFVLNIYLGHPRMA